MSDFPNILVIANCCFSKTDSNGRTLANLFTYWPKEKIADFFVTPVDIDFERCSNYYCISDSEVIKSLTHFSTLKSRPIDKGIQKNAPNGRQKIRKKTPLKAILRNLAWSIVNWKTKEFEDWLDSFNPEVILLMNSDAIFVLRIAEYISNSRNIPIVIFNTEGFYFLKKNCMYQGFLGDTLYRLYQSFYRRAYEDIMRQSSYSFYLNGLLKEDYDKAFNQPSSVLYTASNINVRKEGFNQEHPRFCYIGNFGYKRYEVLIEVGKVLNSIDKNYILEIYGNPLPEIEKKFKESVGIEYRGMLNYQQVLETMTSCDVLFHVESQDEELQDVLRYGFSTKIADSITTGTPFVIYASPDIACSRYIKDTNAGWQVSNPGELKEIIIKIINNSTEREIIKKNSMIVAKENHSVEEVCKKFNETITDIVELRKKNQTNNK